MEYIVSSPQHGVLGSAPQLEEALRQVTQDLWWQTTFCEDPDATEYVLIIRKSSADEVHGL